MIAEAFEKCRHRMQRRTVQQGIIRDGAPGP